MKLKAYEWRTTVVAFDDETDPLPDECRGSDFQEVSLTVEELFERNVGPLEILEALWNAGNDAYFKRLADVLDIETPIDEYDDLYWLSIYGALPRERPTIFLERQPAEFRARESMFRGYMIEAGEDA